MGAWVAFGDAQTAQKEKEFVNKEAALAIVEACEKRDREAEKKIAKKPWWKVFG